MKSIRHGPHGRAGGSRHGTIRELRILPPARLRPVWAQAIRWTNYTAEDDPKSLLNWRVLKAATHLRGRPREAEESSASFVPKSGGVSRRARASGRWAPFFLEIFAVTDDNALVPLDRSSWLTPPRARCKGDLLAGPPSPIRQGGAPNRQNPDGPGAGRHQVGSKGPQAAAPRGSIANNFHLEGAVSIDFGEVPLHPADRRVFPRSVLALHAGPRA